MGIREGTHVQGRHNNSCPKQEGIMVPMRYAVITPRPSHLAPDEASRVIGQYLPGNYEVVTTFADGYHSVRWHATGCTVLIAGTDNSGWTMDDYVLPRLASGLHGGFEIRGVKLVIAHSEVAVHCRVAGHEYHVIEEDRYVNGDTIPEGKRHGCYVLANGRVPMLKSEAGWHDRS